jgi:hypothetical protein
MDNVNTTPVTRSYSPTSITNQGMLSLTAGSLLVTTGIIIFFVGLLIGQMLTYVDTADAAKAVYILGRVLALIGLLLVIISLYMVGLTNTSLEWKIRATMVSSATALMIVTMIISMSFTTFPSYYMYM